MGAATLFGLLLTGKTTPAATLVNISQHLLQTGQWEGLATQPDAVKDVVATTLGTHSAVTGCRKYVERQTTFRTERPCRNEWGELMPGLWAAETVMAGGRMLLVLDAMHDDPRRRKSPDAPFGVGAHACAGEGVTYRYITTALQALTQALPAARLDTLRLPAKAHHVTFSSYDSLLVVAAKA
ncbi:MAG TPA: hypothetical protein VD735_05735 [Candidatus Saccharimonadales bacterium]|nr:hypothetical protein [Candidatus Saccharimonadales bacterium]